MSDKTPMTLAGHKALQDELTRLKGPERRRVAKAIEEARAHGDLSENAEYDAAKNEQGLLEAKIRQIEGKLATAQVIDVARLSGEKIVFGATVELYDCDTGDERTITIVGEDEANIDQGLINFISPLARALIGKSVDDIAKVKLPAGEKEYEIRAVRFVAPE
jgi:transcription elongation factor GreA